MQPCARRIVSSSNSESCVVDASDNIVERLGGSQADGGSGTATIGQLQVAKRAESLAAVQAGEQGCLETTVDSRARQRVSDSSICLKPQIFSGMRAEEIFNRKVPAVVCAEIFQLQTVVDNCRTQFSWSCTIQHINNLLQSDFVGRRDGCFQGPADRVCAIRGHHLATASAAGDIGCLKVLAGRRIIGQRSDNVVCSGIALIDTKRQLFVVGVAVVEHDRFAAAGDQRVVDKFDVDIIECAAPLHGGEDQFGVGAIDPGGRDRRFGASRKRRCRCW